MMIKITLELNRGFYLQCTSSTIIISWSEIIFHCGSVFHFPYIVVARRIEPKSSEQVHTDTQK